MAENKWNCRTFGVQKSENLEKSWEVESLSNDATSQYSPPYLQEHHRYQVNIPVSYINNHLLFLTRAVASLSLSGGQDKNISSIFPHFTDSLIFPQIFFIFTHPGRPWLRHCFWPVNQIYLPGIGKPLLYADKTVGSLLLGLL